MLDQRRQPGPLNVPIDVAGRLASMRMVAGVSAPPILDIDRVRDIEAAVGMRFGDDLLAVFAADVPELQDRLEIRIGLVLGHTGALRQRGARGDLIGIGARPGGVFYCVEKRETPRTETVIVEYDAEERGERALSIVDWLGELGAEPGGGQYAPILAARMTESYREGRRVRHRTFGEGRVLSESGTGPTRKVKADFPGIGLKLLQARFLEFLD